MLSITFIGNKPTTRHFTYAVVYNNNTNVVRFICDKVVDGNDLSTFPHAFVKVKNIGETFFDKIPLTFTAIEGNKLQADWTLTRVITKQLNVCTQLQFENIVIDPQTAVVEQDQVFQFEHVDISFELSIPADAQIAEDYPQILEAMQAEIDGLNYEAGNGIIINKVSAPYNISVDSSVVALKTDIEDLGASLGLAYATSTGTLTATLLNTDGTIIDTKSVVITPSKNLSGLSLDYPNKKIVATFSDGTSLDCDISAMINDLIGKINDEKDRAEEAEEDLEDAISTEKSRAELAESNLQNAINTEKGRAELAEGDLQDAIDYEEERAEEAESVLSASIQDIQDLIPAQASSSNQLGDKAFINSSIATETANFLGTLDVVSDLGLQYGATHAQIIVALNAKTFTSKTNNDYCFVINKDTNQNTMYQKFKWVANQSTFLYEYTLNNSSFTAIQWSAINSGITSTLVAKISTNEQSINTHIADTNNPHSVSKSQVGLGNVDNTSDADKPISTATQTALNTKIENVKRPDGTSLVSNRVATIPYATTSSAGIIKASMEYGLSTNASGALMAYTASYSIYQLAGDTAVIGKGTLENVFTGKGVVYKTTYPSGTNAGVIKATSDYATEITSTGYLRASANTYETYQSASDYMFIGKATLESVLANKGIVFNTSYATDEVAGAFKTSAVLGTSVNSSGYLLCGIVSYSDYQDSANSMFISKGTLNNVLNALLPKVIR